MTGTIITLGITGSSTAIIEKVLNAMGKNEMAQMVASGGIMAMSLEVILLVTKIFQSLSVFAG